MNLLGYIVLALALWLFWAMGTWASRTARAKGRRPIGWVIFTLVGTFFWIIPGVLVVFLLRAQPDYDPANPTRGLVLGSTSATKTCPRCAETVMAAAKVCRYCSYKFQDV